MPAARWGSAVLAAGAILLTSCSAYTEVSVHSSAYRQGVIAGRETRHHHRHYFWHATPYERAAFCIKHAISDIQHMSGSPLNWTEGFEHGCRLAAVVV